VKYLRTYAIFLTRTTGSVRVVNMKRTKEQAKMIKFIKDNFIIAVEGDFHIKYSNGSWNFDLHTERISDYGSCQCLICTRVSKSEQDNKDEIQIGEDDTPISAIIKHIQKYHKDVYDPYFIDSDWNDV
jgi:hypothetical protein